MLYESAGLADINTLLHRSLQPTHFARHRNVSVHAKKSHVSHVTVGRCIKGMNGLVANSIASQSQSDPR